MQALTETQKKPLYTLCPEFASMRFSYTKLGGWNNLSVQEAMENGPGIEGFLNAVNRDLWTKWYRVSKNLDRDNGIAIVPCYTYNHTLAAEHASHGLTDRQMKWQSPMAFSDVKMTGVTKMSIFVHDDPGYAYSFLNLNGATKIKIGSLEEPKDPDKPVQVEELHYWLTSKITEKLTDNKVCVSTTTPNNPSCIEKYIEEKIQCKIPWTFPDTGNYQRKFNTLFQNSNFCPKSLIYTGNQSCQLF